jgi:pimeloyl-[acyl-carrier protein] synthase
VTQGSTATTGVFTAFSPELRANPYPTYHELRSTSPVLPLEGIGVWLVTGYREAVSILRDQRFSTDHRNADVTPSGSAPVDRGLESVMLFMDPPDHTRLRSLVNKAFTPRTVERLRPRIAEIADELLEAAVAKERIDVIADLAYPLPVRVIVELLGIPQSDLPSIKRWSRSIAPILDPAMSVEAFVGVAEAAGELGSYFDELIAHRRKRPGMDLLTELVHAEEDGDALTPEELQATCILLLIAGHETTMNLIGNGLYSLLRNPTELQRLRKHPDLVRGAVEELLRFEGPVHLTARTALQDVRVGDARIEKGQMAIVILAAADRDPAAFADPDRLDLTRSPNRHLAFSAGAHFCLGATLARLEGQIAFPKLLTRMPEIELVEEPPWRDTVTLRGLERLLVTAL